MEVLNMRINWMIGYLNNPRIEVLVDKIPKELRFKKKVTGNHRLYFGEKDGYVYFLCHNPNDQTGFGGSSYELVMEDDSIETIKGPWSSRSGVFNNEGFTHCREVAITDIPRYFLEYRTFQAGHLTVDKLREALEQFMPKLSLVEEIEHNEIYYNPAPTGHHLKSKDKRKEIGMSLYPYRPVEHISKPLADFKNKMAKGMFGLSIDEAHKQKICVSCKDEIGRILQESMNYELDFREWKISGLCPHCFPK